MVNAFKLATMNHDVPRTTPHAGLLAAKGELVRVYPETLAGFEVTIEPVNGNPAFTAMHADYTEEIY